MDEVGNDESQERGGIMSILEAIILGMVQGLTEFLPVSSSGHLAITQNMMNVPEEALLTMSIVLHVGSLISVLFFYGKDVWELIKEFFVVLKEIITERKIRVNNDTRKLGLYIIFASVPAAIVGVFFSDVINNAMGSMLIVGLFLIVTGTILWISTKVAKGTKDIKEMKTSDSWKLGLCQAFATFPGVSRSGSTIAGGLLLGFDREFIAKFSFIMSIPVIAGGFIFELSELKYLPEVGIGFDAVIIGTISSALFGMLAIKVMLNFLQKDKFQYFSYYTWTLGSIIVVTQLMNMF